MLFESLSVVVDLYNVIIVMAVVVSRPAVSLPLGLCSGRTGTTWLLGTPKIASYVWICSTSSTQTTAHFLRLHTRVFTH